MGKAPEILAQTDDKFRENNTMCVGVRWNDFSKQDLIEIVTVSLILLYLLTSSNLNFSVLAAEACRSYVVFSVKTTAGDTVAYLTSSYGAQRMASPSSSK